MEATSTPLPESKPPQGRRARRWACLFVSTFLVLIAACAGVFGLVAYYAVGQLKSTRPYQMSWELLRQDPQVQEALGEPLEEASWMPAGELNVRNGGGDAFFTFDIRGPKGVGHVRTQARRLQGEWGLTALEVTIDATGERISIDTASTSPLDEAPRFKP